MTRPRVVVHNVASLDGRVALSPDVPLLADARWPQVAGSNDAYADGRARHRPQALLEGSGSFVAAGASAAPLPATAAEPGDFLPEDVQPSGWFVVVDGRGRARWEYKERDGWHLLVLACAATPISYLAYLRRERIPYLVRGDEHVDLASALEALASLGVETVVSTGGGRLNGALLRAGLVDAVEVELLPFVVGGETTPVLFTAPDLAPDALPVRLALREATAREDGRVSLRYDVAPA